MSAIIELTPFLAAVLLAQACVGLFAGLLFWAFVTWAVVRPLRRLLRDLDRRPDVAATIVDGDGYRADMKDRLLLLEAQGQGDSPRAQSLRNRLGMVT